MSDLATYRVETPNLTRPRNHDSAILAVTLLASSSERAISRTRGTLFHAYQDAGYLDADYSVTWLHSGPPTDDD